MTFDEWLKDNHTLSVDEYTSTDLLSAWETGREVALDQVRRALSSGNAKDLYDLIDGME